MSNRLVPPCFAFLADTLLIDLRDEAANEPIMAPFWSGLPDGWGGLQDLHQRQQRKLIAMAEAERLLREMAPYELEIRQRYAISGGERKWAPYQGFHRSRCP